jgi:hypothetical protein
MTQTNTVDFLNQLFENNGTSLHCLLTNNVPLNNTSNILDLIHSYSKVKTDISCDVDLTLTTLDLINNILLVNNLPLIELDWDRTDIDNPMLIGLKTKGSNEETSDNLHWYR